MLKRKKIAILLDIGISLTGLILLVTFLSGGFQLTIGEKVIGLRSYQNPLILFILFIGIRILMYGKPFSWLEWKLQGAATRVWASYFTVFSLIIIYFASAMMVASTAQQKELIIKQGDISGFSPAASFTAHEGKVRLKSDGQYILAFSITTENTSGFSKIRLNFSKETDTENLNILKIVYKNKGDEAIRGLSTVRIVRGVFSYDIPLTDNDFDIIQVIIKTNLEHIDSEITKISLLSTEAFDFKYISQMLALLIVFLLLMPGFFIVSALSAKSKSVTLLLIGMFAASLSFYLLLYAVLELSFLSGLNQPGIWLILTFVLSLAFLLYLNYRRDRFATLNYYIYSTRAPVFIFAVALMLLTAYVSFDTPLPFQNMGWQSISGPKTFDVFNAHDNYFQFANGRVIAENLPFSVEYGDRLRPLVFMPEDREMLAGAVYAVFRSMSGIVSPAVGDSFMSYTILGIAMNLMIIFPVAAFLKRYIESSSQWLLIFLVFLLFGNSVFIVESSLTWFKFSGAALYLSALIVLLRDREKLSSWMLAGFLFGLAVNMHAAVALGIPLFFLWFVYLRGQATGFRVKSWLTGPALLIAMFVLVNLPWKLVKKYTLNDSIDMLTGFFFAGTKVEGSIYKSALLFFNNVPVNEQVIFRLERLLLSFRLEELFNLPQVLLNSGIGEYLLQWTQYETGYTVFLYYPLFLLMLVLFIFNRYSTVPDGSGVLSYGLRGRSLNSELKLLVIIGLATQLLIVIGAYSYNHPPDVSWVQPFGVTILVYLGMLLLLVQTRLTLLLLMTYVLLSYIRLYVAYQFVVLPG